MKDAEDEAFDELAKKQGMWGGGFQAKRAMAADKFQEPVLDIDGHVVGKMRKPKPAQELVALVIDGVLVKSALPEKYTGHLYTTPPQRPWVGLTDGEVRQMCGSVPSMKEVVREAEAKLKDKNT